MLDVTKDLYKMIKTFDLFVVTGSLFTKRLLKTVDNVLKIK